jgi:hypothetical protein
MPDAARERICMCRPPPPTVLELLQAPLLTVACAVLVFRMTRTVTRGSAVLPACDVCGYSFEGLADDARCPECGNPERRAKLVRWQGRLLWHAVMHLALARVLIAWATAATTVTITADVTEFCHAPRWLYADGSIAERAWWVWIGFLCSATTCMRLGHRARWVIAWTSAAVWACAVPWIAVLLPTSAFWMKTWDRLDARGSSDSNPMSIGVVITALALATLLVATRLAARCWRLGHSHACGTDPACAHAPPAPTPAAAGL